MRASDAMGVAVAKLRAAGLPSPVADARILLTHLLGAPGGLFMAAEPTSSQLIEFTEMIGRRAAGEPVQHITGLAPFRYEELRVGPGVFIPRPETEQLVEAALRILATRPAGQRRVVELCAGSGAITLSLAREMGALELYAIELSESAWPYLVHNLAGVDVRLVLGDMEDAFPELNGQVDVVLANPPYVPETDRALLPLDVVGQDPDTALFSGRDGLDALKVVRDVAERLLKPGGWVVAEHDEKQSSAMLAIFTGSGFTNVSDEVDLTGRPRHIVAQRVDSEKCLRETRGVDVAGLSP